MEKVVAVGPFSEERERLRRPRTIRRVLRRVKLAPTLLSDSKCSEYRKRCEVGVKARIKWVESVMFVAESGSGHSVVIDGAPEAGGRNLGFRPMEMMLIGLGSCSAFDVVTILRRGREQVTDCVVELDGQRADADPKVFTAVELVYKVSGKNLDPKKVERAVNLSAEKYCSASKMFAATAKLTHRIEIVEQT